MKEWSVEIIVAGEVDSSFLELALARLAARHPALGHAGGTWSARFDVAAADAGSAISLALAILEEEGLALRADVVHTEASTIEYQEQQLERPNMADMVGLAEAAAVLGVTKQRVWQLQHAHPDFPPPAIELKATPIWLRSSIEAFAREWPRRPGRPRRTVTGSVRGQFIASGQATFQQK